MQLIPNLSLSLWKYQSIISFAFLNTHFVQIEIRKRRMQKRYCQCEGIVVGYFYMLYNRTSNQSLNKKELQPITTCLLSRLMWR
jgi:hypothetical protein